MIDYKNQLENYKRIIKIKQSFNYVYSTVTVIMIVLTYVPAVT